MQFSCLCCGCCKWSVCFGLYSVLTMHKFSHCAKSLLSPAALRFSRLFLLHYFYPEKTFLLKRGLWTSPFSPKWLVKKKLELLSQSISSNTQTNRATCSQSFPLQLHVFSLRSNRLIGLFIFFHRSKWLLSFCFTILNWKLILIAFKIVNKLSIIHFILFLIFSVSQFPAENRVIEPFSCQYHNHSTHNNHPSEPQTDHHSPPVQLQISIAQPTEILMSGLSINNWLVKWGWVWWVNRALVEPRKTYIHTRSARSPRTFYSA